MKISDIESALSRLRARGVPFFSEADLQHQLSWELHKIYEDGDFHLEVPFQHYKPSKENSTVYVDIVIFLHGKRIGLELKYKTTKYDFVYRDRPISLKNQGAQNNCRYDIFKDIERLQHLIDKGLLDEGFSISLTNDTILFQKKPRDPADIGANFFLTDRKAGDCLLWNEGSKNKNLKSRGDPITLLYDVIFVDSVWHEYGSEKNSKFLCKIVQCSPEGKRL